LGEYIADHFGADARSLGPSLLRRLSPEDVDVGTRVCFACLGRLMALEPRDPRWALGLGHLLLGRGREGEALAMYLYGGAVQTGFFRDPLPVTRTAGQGSANPGAGLGRSQLPFPVLPGWGSVDMACGTMGQAPGGFILLEERMLRRVVHCLLAGHHATAAIVACQCFVPPDYASAINLASERSPHLTTPYMAYLWEIPVIEKLLHVTGREPGGVRKAALLSVMQNPALNEFNPKEMRHAHAGNLKRSFFQALFADLGLSAGAARPCL